MHSISAAATECVGGRHGNMAGMAYMAYMASMASINTPLIEHRTARVPSFLPFSVPPPYSPLSSFSPPDQDHHNTERISSTIHQFRMSRHEGKIKFSGAEELGHRFVGKEIFLASSLWDAIMRILR